MGRLRVVGSLFGLADAAGRDVAELDDYATTCTRAAPSTQRLAREQLARSSEHRGHWRAGLLETVNFITVALLPAQIREQYGFSSLPPAPIRELTVNAYAAYVKRGVLPFVPGRLRRISLETAA